MVGDPREQIYVGNTRSLLSVMFFTELFYVKSDH